MIRSNVLFLLIVACVVSGKADKIGSNSECNNIIDKLFQLLTLFKVHDFEPYEEVPVLTYPIRNEYLSKKASVAYVTLHETQVKGLSNLRRTEHCNFVNVFGHTGGIIQISPGRLTVTSQGLLVIDGKRQPITLSMTTRDDIRAQLFLTENHGEPSVSWIKLNLKYVTTTYGDLGTLGNSFEKDSAPEAFKMISIDFFRWLFEKELVRILNRELRMIYKAESLHHPLRSLSISASVGRVHLKTKYS